MLWSLKIGFMVYGQGGLTWLAIGSYEMLVSFASIAEECGLSDNKYFDVQVNSGTVR
jgi:hypothetical protein